MYLEMWLRNLLLVLINKMHKIILKKLYKNHNNNAIIKSDLLSEFFS